MNDEEKEIFEWLESVRTVTTFDTSHIPQRAIVEMAYATYKSQKKLGNLTIILIILTSILIFFTVFLGIKTLMG
jgi:hypothetical protein